MTFLFQGPDSGLTYRYLVIASEKEILKWDILTSWFII